MVAPQLVQALAALRLTLTLTLTLTLWHLSSCRRWPLFVSHTRTSVPRSDAVARRFICFCRPCRQRSEVPGLRAEKTPCMYCTWSGLGLGLGLGVRAREDAVHVLHLWVE